MKIGFGYDAHRFAPGRELMIGGVKIPYHQGLQGHSDADVLLHSLSDAMLGALGLGDIGVHFPDTDAAYLGASSLDLLSRVFAMVRSEGYSVLNTDSVVVAQAPKIAPFIDQMRRNIAKALQTEPGRLNIKATTTEGMGFTGRGEGISAYSVCLLVEGK